jgi:hypothetical protein
LIEDQLYEGDNSAGGNGLDYVAIVNFENNFNEFRSLVEKSATQHFNFWNILVDSTPDLNSLKDQGAKINQTITLVEEQWRRLC